MTDASQQRQESAASSRSSSSSSSSVIFRKHERRSFLSSTSSTSTSSSRTVTRARRPISSFHSSLGSSSFSSTLEDEDSPEIEPSPGDSGHSLLPPPPPSMRAAGQPSPQSAPAALARPDYGQQQLVIEEHAAAGEPEELTDFANCLDLNPPTHQQAEAKGTSSSSSSSASSSPLTSRHSSDCDGGAPAKSSKGQSGETPERPPTSTTTSSTTSTITAAGQDNQDSSSSSGEASSSRRLIRRRTVRRSYHHHHHHQRASDEQEQNSAESSPRVITRTITTTTRSVPPTTTTGAAAAVQQVATSVRLLTPPAVRGETTGSGASSSTSTSRSTRLSTSRSSSKIASSSRVDETAGASSAMAHNNLRPTTTVASNSTDLRRAGESLFERRAANAMRTAAAAASTSTRLEEAAERLAQDGGESHHHRSSESLSTSSSSTFNATTASRSLTSSTRLAGSGGAALHHHQAAVSSSSAASSCETSSSLTRTSAARDQRHLAAATTTREQSSSLANQQQQSFSSSMFLSTAAAAAAAKQRSFLASPDSLLFSSPDLRSFVQEIGTDFAALANSTSLLVKEHQQQQQLFTRATTSRLLGAGPRPSLLAAPSSPKWRPKVEANPKSLDSLIDETKCTIQELEDNPPAAAAGGSKLRDFGSASSNAADRGDSNPNTGQQHSARIQELLDKAQRHGTGGISYATSALPTVSGELVPTSGPQGTDTTTTAAAQQLQESDRCKAVMNESIVRIEQRMSDLCRKFETCDDTQKAIDLLKIMIQMIEKAWSVPVCGDDLGFKLCTSLRQFGGLDIILGFVREAEERSLLELSGSSLSSPPSSATSSPANKSLDNNDDDEAQASSTATITTTRPAPIAVGVAAAVAPKQQLKLNLSHIHGPEVEGADGAREAPNDNDSDILTSDLGLDSAADSVESLASSSTEARADPAPEVAPAPEVVQDSVGGAAEAAALDEQAAAAATSRAEEQMARVRKEELVFLSAHLLSQCLTLENRDYIVACGQLDPVIKLACNFTTMKSNQSKRLLKRSALMRQSSTMKQQQQQQVVAAVAAQATQQATEVATPTNSNNDKQLLLEQRGDMHSAIGTEVLQHLFKHSEETCTRMISLGALQAVLYGCRSSHVETLRHCASALANLALYGGPDSQQTMIEHKAHVWLFPLAFNEDDNVQYYACLAIVVLAANQEIEADVLQSSTLDLVEPFVTSHEPRKFAESTTSHIHGQSASWLRKLMPLLESKREEARNLACFHFAMEAHIKREQGRTALFGEIGSLEPLRRAGSSPLAIASKFACQALRLIGVPEPHKLSQQVPLWTCEDVCEWVVQVGFERFRGAFRESHVDGDLLLQLDEEALKFDIGIENGIIRRRFLRELAQLKRIADYSSVDRTQLGLLLMNAAASTSVASAAATAVAGTSIAGCVGPPTGAPTPAAAGLRAHGHLFSRPNPSGGGGTSTAATHALQNHRHHHASPPTLTSAQARNARDFLQYIYPIIQLGVTRDNIHLVDCDQLLAECRIANALHRVKLAQAIRELQEVNQLALEAAASSHETSALLGGCSPLAVCQKTLDVFVSYRRSTGSQLASLLKVHLQLRGFSVFIDVERLEAGKFDNNLLDSIKQAKNFILVLSPGALDRCIGDHECKDWVHKEIVAALASNCNIIPIIDNFHWPDGDQLPEDMRSITYFNGIRWIHDYQDACVDKVERFIRGELSNSSMQLMMMNMMLAGGGSVAGSTISSGSAGGAGCQQVASTPSVSAYGQRLGYGAAPQAVATPSMMGPPPPTAPAATPSMCSGQNFQTTSTNHNGVKQSGGDATTADNGVVATISTSGDTVASSAQQNNQHPLASAHANPYLQFNSGNVNPNIRLR